MPNSYHYIRVSTRDQNLDRQIAALNEYKPASRVFQDKQSGKNFDRPGYLEMKKVLQPGDEVIIKELDRLGRDLEGIKEEMKWFKDHQITLRVLDVPTTLIDFHGQTWVQDMVNNILIEVLGHIAEQERMKMKQRQREGIDAMKVVNGVRVSNRNGATYGRKCGKVAEFDDLRQAIQRGERTVTDVCKELGISRYTWYNWMKK